MRLTEHRKGMGTMAGSDFLSSLLRRGAEVAHKAADELDRAGRSFLVREEMARVRSQIEAKKVRIGHLVYDAFKQSGAEAMAEDRIRTLVVEIDGLNARLAALQEEIDSAPAAEEGKTAAEPAKDEGSNAGIRDEGPVS